MDRKLDDSDFDACWYRHVGHRMLQRLSEDPNGNHSGLCVGAR
jgi:hypothetical protein